jgi:hypothetical protein
LPRLDTTPPVTKTYFADIAAASLFGFWDWPYLVGTVKYDRKSGAGEGKMERQLLVRPTTGSSTRQFFVFQSVRWKLMLLFPSIGRTNPER